MNRIDTASETVLRDEQREAVTALGGFREQFLHVVQRLMSSPPGTQVWTECAEDLQTVGSGVRTLEQIKSSEKNVSITTEEMATVLNSWSAYFHEHSTSEEELRFAFLSPAPAGNSQRSPKDAFPKWVSARQNGEEQQTATSDVHQLLRTYFNVRIRPNNDKKSNGFRKGENWPDLDALLRNKKEFDRFWRRIDWRLGSPSGQQLQAELIDLLGTKDFFPRESEDNRRQRLESWVGQILASSISSDVNDRLWTLDRLMQIKVDVAKLARVENNTEQALRNDEKTHSGIQDLKRELSESRKEMQQLLQLHEQLPAVRSVSTRTPSDGVRVIQAERWCEGGSELLGQVAGDSVREIQELQLDWCFDKVPDVVERLEQRIVTMESLPPSELYAAKLEAVALRYGSFRLDEPPPDEELDRLEQRLDSLIGQSLEVESTERSEDNLLIASVCRHWFRDRKEKAIELLQNAIRPRPRRLLLTLLILCDRPKQAIGCYRSGWKFEVRYAAVLVTAAAQERDDEFLADVVKQIGANPSTDPREQIGSLAGSCTEVLRTLADSEGFINPFSLSDSDRRRLRIVQSALSDRLRQAAVVPGFPATVLESRATGTLWRISNILGDQEVRRWAAKQLNRAAIVTTDGVQAVLQGHVPCDDDTLTRLKAHKLEGEEAWECDVTIGRILADRLNQPEVALDHYRKLLTRANDQQKLETVGTMLVDLLSGLSGKLRGSASQLLGEHFPEEHSTRRVDAILGALQNDKLDRAEELLIAWDAPDDSSHRQCQIILARLRGEIDEALEHLDAIIPQASNLELRETRVELLLDRKRLDEAETALEELTRVAGETASALRCRHRLLVARRRFEEADNLFDQLRNSGSNSFPNTAAHVWSLEVRNKLEEALNECRVFAKDFPKQPSVRIGLVRTLFSTGRREEALEALDEAVEAFPGNLPLLRMAISVFEHLGKPQRQRELVLRLAELEDSLPEEQRQVRRIESFDDLKQYEEQQLQASEALKQVRQRYLAGQSFWVFDALLQHQHPALAHAGMFDREVEDVLYATQGFSVLPEGDSFVCDKLKLDHVPETLVVDLSALLTLNRLEALHDLSDAVPKILVSEVQVGCLRALVHSLKLVEHEGGEVASKLMQRVQENRIGLDDTSTSTSWSASQIVRWLHDRGRLPASRVQSLPPEVIETEVTDFPPDGVVLISYETWNQLCEWNLQSDALSLNTLTLNTAAVEKLREIEQRRARAQELLAPTTRLLDWVTTADAVSVLLASTENSGSVQIEEPALDARITFGATRLAEERTLPFLVDDRNVLRFHSGASERRHQSASTFEFLAALRRAEFIEDARYGHLVERLLRADVRFWLPDVDLLLHWSRQGGTDDIPAVLHEVARYAHSAIADPGLLCGVEPTDPPTTIALQYLFVWIETLAEYVVRLQLEAALPDDLVERLTRWASQECLPGLPPTTNTSYRFESLVLELFLNWTLVNSPIGHLAHSERMRTLPQVLRHQLGLTNLEFERIVLSVLENA